MSTTMAGAPYSSMAATASTILSAPTSLGLSYRMRRPVRGADGHHHGVDAEEGLADVLENHRQRRHHAANAGGGDFIRLDPLQPEQVGEQYAVFVGTVAACP